MGTPPPAAATGSEPWVRWERRGAVALVTLGRAPVNVLSREMLDRLTSTLDEVEKDPAVRAVVLTSALEKAFAAGADIHEMAAMGPAQARVHGGRGQAMTVKIATLPLPVIAAVHGVCFGGGMEMVLACDFIVASEDAQFGQPEIQLGVMPGWGGTRRLPRRVGAARARDWILTGRPVAAAEAKEAGLVVRVVPRTELVSAAVALAETLASKPAVALAAAKFAVNRSLDPGESAGLAYELDLWSRLFGLEDQREGMRAFLEKRPPRFPGRGNWAHDSEGFPWGGRRGPRSPRRRSVHRPRGGRRKK
jgi:enoyl-CoA hydratase